MNFNKIFNNNNTTATTETCHYCYNCYYSYYKWYIILINAALLLLYCWVNNNTTIPLLVITVVAVAVWTLEPWCFWRGPALLHAHLFAVVSDGGEDGAQGFEPHGDVQEMSSKEEIVVVAEDGHGGVPHQIQEGLANKQSETQITIQRSISQNR